MVEFVFGLLCLLFAGLIGATIWMVLQAVGVSTGKILVKPTTRKRRVDPQLEERLLTLCGGNHALARRLVAHARDYNRDRSEEWCYEKAIADLIRDRYGR